MPRVINFRIRMAAALGTMQEGKIISTSAPGEEEDCLFGHNIAYGQQDCLCQAHTRSVPGRPSIITTSDAYGGVQEFFQICSRACRCC